MLLVTHSMEEAQRLCDRMVILQDGEIIADGSPQQIVGRTGVQRTTFQAEVDELVLTELEQCEDVAAVARSGGAIVVDGGDASPQAVLAHLARRGIRARGVGVDRPTLEDAYHRLVTGEEHENAAPGVRPADERTLR